MVAEHSMWWPWMGMWIFPMIMFVVIIIFVFIFAGLRGGCCARWIGPGRYHSEGVKAESALDILKKRYAKGEITKEEFEQMKKDIIG